MHVPVHSLQRLQDKAHLLAGIWEIFVMGSIFSGHPMLTWPQDRRQVVNIGYSPKSVVRRCLWQSEWGIFLILQVSGVIWKKTQNPKIRNKSGRHRRKNLCWFFLCVNSSSEVYLRWAYEIGFTLLKGRSPTSVTLHPNSLLSLNRVLLGC